ncbi:hypothetical protein R5R35_004479 [Gryllus longicercus]|uniref:Uncharacterized protein n=1 Tax=Gryllus longicercus TaxID=2509291 RepID=A0AAN9VKP0_9ORTH
MNMGKDEQEPHTHWKKDDGESAGNESPGFSIGEQTPPAKRENRQVSRRAIALSQGQNMHERPYTQQSRSGTSDSRSGASGRSSNRTLSASVFASRGSVLPGTASRLTSAMRQSPVSRVGTTISFAGTQVNVVDRPITQQGLSGMRSSTRGPQMRQVQDKRYFEGLLQTKIRDLSNEITRLGKEIEIQQQEQAVFLVYDKRVKEKASELTELQGQLADVNVVLDKINTDTEKGEVDAECQELHTRNKQESQHLEQLFAQCKQSEKHIQRLEMEIEQERHMTDNLLQAMSPLHRERYSELQITNEQLQQQMETLQQQLDSINARKNALEDQLAVSQTKQEAVRLHHKLQEAEAKKQTLLQEEKNHLTPVQEREQLFQRVKHDNAEIATMDRKIYELKELIYKKQEELDQIEQDLDESQSERHQKYRELRRREETMEQFLSSFEESKNQELTRISQLEEQVINALHHISKNLVHAGHLPSVDEFSLIKDNLTFKEGELEKSKKTLESLTKEQLQLQTSLEKIGALEDKIKLEMETLKEKMQSMTNEMTTLSDLEKLRKEADVKTTQLENERKMLEEQNAPALEAVREMQNKYDTLKVS